jgi:outer membrane cobalamin receptor
VQLGAVVSFVGSRDDLLFAQFPAPTTRVTLPSYRTVDLSSRVVLVQARHGFPGFAAQARVENLFDEQYQQIAGYLSRGRTLVIGVSSQLR